jgi:hypothetical protein
MPELVHSVPVEAPDGRRVRVLFYDDGSYRFRVYETPLYLAECYVQGGRNDFSILKLVPPTAIQATPSEEDQEAPGYLGFQATAWWDRNDNTIHLGVADPAMRARHKPGSYTWRKLFPALATRNPEMYDRNPDMQQSISDDEEE